jgi:hypothetical protein
MSDIGVGVDAPRLLLTRSGHEAGPLGYNERHNSPSKILHPKCDIPFVPDVVLGMGEAMRRREFIAFVGGTCSHRGQSVDPDPKPTWAGFLMRISDFTMETLSTGACSILVRPNWEQKYDL